MEINSQVYLLAGLGNPGRQYRENRHNIGFLVIDHLADQLKETLNKLKSNALITEVRIEDKKVILAKPQTFMNLSGQAIASLVRFYKIPLSNVLVVYDDIDLPVGVIRLRTSGGAGGQKGLASTIDKLGTNQFSRLRVGIGRPPGRMQAADYVLKNFLPDEKEIIQVAIEKAAEASLHFVKTGIENSMNKFNGSVEKE